jgi:hypothetical protein
MLPHLYAHGMRLAACWRCHAVLSTYLSLVALLTREQQPRLTKAILEPVILAGSAFSPCLSARLAELGSVLDVDVHVCDQQVQCKLRVRMSESPKFFRLRRWPPAAPAAGYEP